MNYVQTSNGKFLRYLDGFTVTYFNENNNCEPRNLTPEQALELGVFKLQMVTPPAYDPLTQLLTLVDAVFINGAWTQVWQVTELDPKQQAQKEAEVAAQNKQQATALLQETDWTCTVDINNPQYSNPYLMNQDAFLAYRSTVRAIAVNPPTTPATFPEQPQEVWSS